MGTIALDKMLKTLIYKEFLKFTRKILRRENMYQKVSYRKINLKQN